MGGISKEEFFYNLSTNNIKIYQPSINVWKDEIEKIFATGEDVLFLGMSSRFAGGIKNLNIAKNLLKPKTIFCTVLVVNRKCNAEMGFQPRYLYRTGKFSARFRNASTLSEPVVLRVGDEAEQDSKFCVS